MSALRQPLSWAPPRSSTSIRNHADELVGGRLQCLGIRCRQERVVVFAKPYCLLTELDFHEVVAVEIVGRLKRKVCADAHGEGTDHRIADQKIVVQVPR